MCVLACLFLIIDEIIFRGNTQGSGHGSSDFPRLKCVTEHGADVCVCVRTCVCFCVQISVHRGSPELKAPFLMFGLGYGLVRREITNRLTH